MARCVFANEPTRPSGFSLRIRLAEAGQTHHFAAKVATTRERDRFEVSDVITSTRERSKPAAILLVVLAAMLSALGSLGGAGSTQSASAYLSQQGAEPKLSGPQPAMRAHRAGLAAGHGDDDSPVGDLPGCAGPDAGYERCERASRVHPAPHIAFARVRDGLTRAPPRA